jgi:hypothetical protein
MQICREAPEQVLISLPMSRQVFEPNQFVLGNSEAQIVYSISSRAGVPQLDYQRELNLTHHFSGDEITVMETPIGRLITVTLESDFKQQREGLLALLLPTIHLTVGEMERSMQTEVILTTRRLPQLGRSRRVEGQVETYEIQRLSGTAQLVEF